MGPSLYPWGFWGKPRHDDKRRSHVLGQFPQGGLTPSPCQKTTPSKNQRDSSAALGGPNVMALYEGLPSRSGEEWFEMACCHAALAGAAGRERSGIPAGDGESEAGKATTLLRKAVAVGYRNTDAMTKESGTVQ